MSSMRRLSPDLSCSRQKATTAVNWLIMMCKQQCNKILSNIPSVWACFMALQQETGSASGTSRAVISRAIEHGGYIIALSA